MGSCLSHNRHQHNNAQNYEHNTTTASSNDSLNFTIQHDINSNSNNNTVPTGRNKRLKKDKLKWKSDISYTELELQAKRDEFWETAPVFEGRIEIWNALKAAANALETNNYVLAQAIIDSAQITLPNGNLNDCYDELGNRYQIPNYVLFKPTNIKQRKGSNESNKTGQIECNTTVSQNKDSLDKQVLSQQIQQQQQQPETFQLKFRLSNTNEDIKINVNTNQTIGSIKQCIEQMKSIDCAKQRMFFGGKLMSDKQKIKMFKLQKNYVIQVVVREDEPQL